MKNSKPLDAKFNQGAERKPIYNLGSGGVTPEQQAAKKRQKAERELMERQRHKALEKRKQNAEKTETIWEFIKSEQGLNISSETQYNAYKKLLMLIEKIIETSTINRAIVEQEDYIKIFAEYKQLDEAEKKIFENLKENSDIVSECKGIFKEDNVDDILKKAIRLSNNSALNSFFRVNNFIV